ncbi:MFS transporter [Myxococcota bacterium]|nr:MFS transporter [Myxococcota bacterium]
MRLRPGTVGAAPAWRRNQRAVTATAALLFFGGTLATPFLPLWMHDISGGGRRGDLYAGIALSVTPLLASAMGPVWARLAQRHGLRRSAQRALAAIALHWILLSLASDPGAVLGLRAVLGLLSGFNAMSVALITSGAPDDRIQPIVGQLQTAQIVSAAAAPALGGILYDRLGFRAMCLFPAATALGGLVLVTVAYVELSSSSDAPRRTGDGGVPGLRRSLLGWGLFLVVSTLAVRSLAFLTPRWAATLAASPDDVGASAGAAVTAGAVGESLGAAHSGRAGRAGGLLRPVRTSMALATVLGIALALSTTVPAFLLTRGLLGIAAGGLATFAYAAVAARIPPRGRTASLGTLQSVAMLGGALGPLLASGVAAAAGIAAALWVPAGLFALVLLGALAAPRASARFTPRGEAARAEGEGGGAVRGPPRPPGEGSR